jgi:hypothetical protein
MGEESTTRPPSLTKCSSTGASADDSAGSTSKVCQVPNPITGSFSPDEGMGRINILNASPPDCERAFAEKKHPIALALISRNTVLLEIAS